MDYRKKIENNTDLGNWYNVKYQEMGDGWYTPPEEINKHLDDLGVPYDKRKTLLDVGCGAGHFIAEAEKRVQCTGIDLSHVGCHMARKRTKNSEIWRLPIESFNASDKEAFKYDYICSIGSLEHVINLDKALDNIRGLLKEDGMFYFYCPNEKWIHMDQPNERTMKDEEWIGLFKSHGLHVNNYRRWNDSTAFWGSKKSDTVIARLWDDSTDMFRYFKETSIIENPINGTHGDKLNIGSGQRRFDNNAGWINIDCISREGQIPDVICDVGKERLPYNSETMDMAVLHQVYEHFGLGEGHGLLREICRVLKPGGSLIITVPEMRVLAARLAAHMIDDYTYMANVFGAYQGEPGDRHKWGYTREYLFKDLTGINLWSQIKMFDWRNIPGSDIARDWWILGVECIK